MKKLVPLNSLVIVVGSAPLSKEYLETYFPDYDIISENDVRYNLTGNTTRRDIEGIVVSSIHYQIDAKLRLGERVIVNGINLKKDGRMAIANIGLGLGIPVFYLVCENQSEITKRDVLRGDGIAEVIDLEFNELDPVWKLSHDPVEDIRKKFSGITVIGDIHGMYQSLLAALDWAKTRRHFVIFLGDVIDYGPGTLECADEVYRTIMRGHGEMVLGNHERKISRWIDRSEIGRHKMQLSEGNLVTIDALNKLGPTNKNRWMSRFNAMVSRCPLVLRLDDFVFTHAAVHPSMWIIGAEDHKNMETYSLFGEFEPSPTPFSATERPRRTYKWVDEVPASTTVLVGHDIRSSVTPVTQTNEDGGRAIFLDTGSGKGGYLSSVDLRFTEEGLKMGAFVRH